MTEPSARAALGSAPIPGASPAGQSVSDDSDYEALRHEVMKEPAKGEFTDWPRVVETGSRILREKSKDIPTATYVAVGLLATEGFAGLVDGLRIVEGLLQAHWDGGFPPVPARLRGRVNAIQYLSDACQKALGLRGDPKPAKPADREALLACLQACTDLEKVLLERFADSADRDRLGANLLAGRPDLPVGLDDQIGGVGRGHQRLRNASLYLPTCSSSPSARRWDSIRCRLTYVPFSEPQSSR